MLRKLAEKLLSPEEMEKIEALGGFDAIMNRLKELLAEQKGRHQGGIEMDRHRGDISVRPRMATTRKVLRIGQDESRHRRAVKGLGSPGLQGPGRHCRTRHAWQWKIALTPPTSFRSPGCGNGTGYSGYDSIHRE